MNKVYVNNNEFNLLENPLKVFINSLGMKNFLLNLILKRFEAFNYFYVTQKRIIYVFLFLINYVPSHVNFSQLYLYNLLLIDYSNSYQTFRHLFNLPVNGQRTWGGGRSIKKLKSQLFNYKLKKYLKYTNLNNVLFLSEVINMLWKYQWLHEWIVSKNYFERMPWYLLKKKKFVGATAMMMKRIESFFKHPFKGKKKKHHRRKKIINRAVITTGFIIGFSMTYKKNLV